MLTHPLFTNYIVLRDGTIMNKKTGKVLKPQTNKQGYLYVRLRKDMKHHNRGVHRLILQTYNPIENDHLYHAHHIDEVKHHNHIGNLRWELIEDHIREHKSFISDETRKRMSESQKGRVISEEHKRKMSESLKGRKHSEETRKRMSESHLGVKKSDETRRRMSEGKKGSLCWNNGTKTIRSKECPGEGWTRGVCKVS